MMLDVCIVDFKRPLVDSQLYSLAASIAHPYVLIYWSGGCQTFCEAVKLLYHNYCLINVDFGSLPPTRNVVHVTCMFTVPCMHVMTIMHDTCLFFTCHMHV